jgi:pimeloyl-ACP methyl ester carboxylesterase
LSAPEFRSTLSRVRRPLSERGIETLASALDRDLQNAGERGVDIAGYNLVEVAADVEAARSKLGYETIDLYSVSYGGQVAYTYCLEYPERVGRNVMVCADAPGHLAIRDCATVDSLLAHYGKLWSREPEFTRRCEDLVACVKTVLDALERRGQPDPDKVKIMTVTMLYSTSSAAYVFDAYLDAYDGNYEKLSRLSTAFDYGMHRAALWGDFYLKLYSMGEIDPDDEHSEPLKSRSCIMGSPLFELFFGPARLLKSRVPAVPKQLREGQFCNVSTLFVSGSLDFSGPAENVRKFLLPYFGNGRLVVLSEFGHSDVPGTVQPEAFYHLVMTFLNDGTVDDSQYEYAPVEFEPSTSFEAWLRGER